MRAMTKIVEDEKTERVTQRVALISSGADHCDLFFAALQDFEISRVAPDQLYAFQTDPKFASALVIVDCEALTADVADMVRRLGADQPRPVMVFADTGSPELAQQVIREGASACIIDGLQEHRIASLVAVALERFRQSDEIRRELHKTQATLESRKTVERAKGVLMDQRGLSESEAYELMRKTAMKQARPLREVAESILSVSEFWN